MSTHVPIGFNNFLDFLHYFVLAKIATTSIRVNTPGKAATVMGIREDDE